MANDRSGAQHSPGILVSRRGFLAAGAGAALAGTAAATGSADRDPPQAGRRLLVRGGHLLTCDPALGEMPGGDLLVEDGRIVAVGASAETVADAFVLDATGMVVMPGFVDTHRHLWQGALRHALPDGTLEQYFQRIIGQVRPRLAPEDVRVGNLLSALGALHAGVTTVLDWSHAGNSPAHSDAALEALRESGIRAVYAFGTGTLLPLAEHMGPDNTYIHCCNLTDAEWRLVAATGGGVSVAGPVEMQMGHGVPPFQAALDHGVPLGLGNDVETSVSGEFFGQMRMALALQRMLVHERARRGERDLPALLTVRDVLAMATLGGARVNHLAARTGSLTPGKQADFIVLDPGTVNVLPLNDPVGAVVQSMDTANVRHVFVAGRARKWDGRLVGVDVARLRRLAEASRDRLLGSD